MKNDIPCIIKVSWKLDFFDNTSYYYYRKIEQFYYITISLSLQIIIKNVKNFIV